MKPQNRPVVRHTHQFAQQLTLPHIELVGFQQAKGFAKGFGCLMVRMHLLVGTMKSIHRRRHGRLLVLTTVHFALGRVFGPRAINTCVFLHTIPVIRRTTSGAHLGFTVPFRPVRTLRIRRNPSIRTNDNRVPVDISQMLLQMRKRTEPITDHLGVGGFGMNLDHHLNVPALACRTFFQLHRVCDKCWAVTGVEEP